MEKRIIYRTEVSVSNMMLEAEKGMEICSEEVEEVFLAGYIPLLAKEAVRLNPIARQIRVQSISSPNCA